MPISPYVRELRERVGSTRLLLPSLTALMYDDRGGLLLVEPRRVFGVYGGPEFIVRYPNGDESQYVMIVFECAVVGGTLRPDDDETLEARYWTADEAAALPLTPWLRTMLASFYTRPSAADFHPPRWQPSG